MISCLELPLLAKWCTAFLRFLILSVNENNFPYLVSGKFEFKCKAVCCYQWVTDVPKWAHILERTNIPRIWKLSKFGKNKVKIWIFFPPNIWAPSDFTIPANTCPVRLWGLKWVPESLKGEYICFDNVTLIMECSSILCDICQVVSQ